MIATTRRMAIHDFLLITFAVIAITLSVLPKEEARQKLLFRDPSGNIQAYSLKADDPRLAALERRIANWARYKPNPRLAMKKWHAEVADYYAARTEAKSANRDPIVAVSFADDNSTIEDTSETDQLSEEHAYWIHLAANAREVIAKAEMEMHRRQHLAGPPPISFGELDAGGHSPRMLILAGVFGICVACGFARWTYVCPSIRLQSVETTETPSIASETHDAGDELQLAIPDRWVRLHQPITVLIRQTAYCTLLVLGVLCALI